MAIDIKFFYEDAYAQLQSFNDVIESIKNGTQDSEKIGELFRAVHTLKSSASVFDLDDIVKLSHKSEDLLDLIRQGKIVFTKDIGALFLEIRDVVSKLVELTKDNSKPNTILAQQILEIYSKLEASKVIQPEVKTINKPVVAKKQS